MKEKLKSLLPSTVKTNIGFTTKISAHAVTLKFEHKHDIDYLEPCPEDNCFDNYISESRCRIFKRIVDHNNRDQQLHIFRFKTIGNEFNINPFQQKVSQALLIKQIKPSLKVQTKSIELKLLFY